MHQRGQTISFQLRLEIMEQASAGLNDTHIATSLDCSVWTVRKWRRRAVKCVRVGLASQMGRPATGPMSTFPKALEEAILHLRKRHAGWGPATLLAALKMDAYWRDEPLPSHAQIARLLKQAGLRLPIQGITKTELMGELAVLQSLPIYQLALPFSLAA